MALLALYGLSGSGKSTTAALAREYFARYDMRVRTVKLAEPLYDLQQRFYAVAGKAIGPYDQDQQLLERIAAELRRISPTSLVDDFDRRCRAVEADVVLNDDLRDPHVDYLRLAELGFHFIRIRCDERIRIERLARRGDLTHVYDSRTTSEIDLIPADAVVDNSVNELSALREKVEATLERFL